MMRSNKILLIFFSILINTLLAMDLNLLSYWKKKVEDKIQYRFILAISNNNLQQAKCWYKMGAKINRKGNSGCLPIHFAAIAGNYEIFFWLASLGTDWAALADHGRSTLLFAADVGCLPIINFCLKNGMHVNKRNDDFRTPLTYAARSAQHKALQFLLQKDANANARDYLGKSALHHASEVNADLLIKEAEVDSEKFKKLKIKKLLELKSVVLSLVRSGANIEAEDYSGMTPLSYATTKKNKLVGVLLELGAEPCTKDKQGMTPFLHAAANKNKRALLELLLAVPESILFAQRDSNNYSALQIANGGLDFEIIELLTNKEKRHAKLDILISEKIGNCSPKKNIFYGLRDQELGFSRLQPFKHTRPPD